MDEILKTRLRNEHAMMQELCQRSSLVRCEYSGNPPTKYCVTLSCRGLYLNDEDPPCLLPIDHHEFDLLLDTAFPYVPPQIIWKTPVFHPNFKAPLVCLGDHWYPSSSLRDVCIALCELIQYKKFNIDDPLHPPAAAWLLEALHRGSYPIPVDGRLVINDAAASHTQPGSIPLMDPSLDDFALIPQRSSDRPAPDVIHSALEGDASADGGNFGRAT